MLFLTSVSNFLDAFDVFKAIFEVQEIFIWCQKAISERYNFADYVIKVLRELPPYKRRIFISILWMIHYYWDSFMIIHVSFTI